MSSLFLIHCLSKFTEEHGKKWFEKNMLKLTLASAEDQVSKVSGPNSAWLRAYYIFIGADARGSQEHIPKELRDRLDGESWV